MDLLVRHHFGHRLLAGLVLCMKQAKRYGLTEDNVLDMVLWAVPSCIIGAAFTM